MNKLFVTSDIHSYFSVFKDALDKSGYDSSNPTHWLIICGDLFDRGGESQKVLDYFKDKERCILIRGNHETLLLECLNRGYYENYDVSNGTLRTIMTLGEREDYYNGMYVRNLSEYNKACAVTENKVNGFINNMVNYFETENYIFVHSWIPTNTIPNKDLVGLGNGLAEYYGTLEYKDDWREAHEWEWEDSRWGNPFKNACNGLNKTGKTIVAGHWHTSWYRAHVEGTKKEFGDGACFDIVHDTKNGLIGIDACTAHTKQCNILVLEDNFINE